MHNSKPILPKEMEYLTEHLRLTTDISPDRRLSVPVADLLDETKCLSYLDRVADVFESPSTLVTASQFAKRYSFLTIAPSLYAMTMFNKGFDHSAPNCHIESVYREETWLPEARLADWQITQPTTDSNRQEWRDQMLNNIFAGNLAKVWRSISKAASIPTPVLWENAAVYVYWLYEKRIGDGVNESQKSRIREDFHYLVNEAPASLFGETVNPLAKFNSPKSRKAPSDQPIRIRKTCCYYYQISPNQAYCSTCPKNI